MELTATQVITRALRLIRVIGQDETPSANDVSTAYDALVSMLDGWAGDPLMVPDLAAEFTMPGFVDATTPVTIPEGSWGLRRMMTYALAVEVAPEFGVVVDPRVAAEAEHAMRNWQKRVAGLHAGRVTHDPSLVRRRHYNILAG